MHFCLLKAEMALVVLFPDLLQDPRRVGSGCIRTD